MKKIIRTVTLSVTLLGAVMGPIELIAGNQIAGEITPNRIILGVAIAATFAAGHAVKSAYTTATARLYSDLFHDAIRQGSVVGVTILLELGANVNTEYLDRYPLENAAEEGHLDVVKYLIKKGATVNAKSALGGLTALHRAALYHHLNIIKYLLENGANIDKQDNDGDTPLQLATDWNYLDVIKELINKSADPTLKNSQGRTARDIAHAHNRPATEKYLALAEDFPKVVNNTMDINTFFKTHGFMQQVLDDVFSLAIMTGSYETLKKLYDFDPETFSATTNRLTKIDFTASPAKNLSWHVQLLGIAIGYGSTKLFHKIVTLSHAIDGLPSIINGVLLQTEKLEQPSDRQLVTQIKELRKAWVTACKEKEYFTTNSTNLLKTKFALEQKTYQENTFDGKKLIKTEEKEIPGFITPQVLSYLSKK